MAVLQKIRVKFGVVISVIIALALLSFIIDPSTLETALNSMSSKYDVGRIAGKSVSYNDYAADVETYTTINEMMTGTSVQNEQTQQQIRNAAWQALLDKYMFVKNAKAAGISVGEAEILDLTSGERVSPMISQNPAFCDENGVFSKEALVAFVQNIDADESGRLRTYWNYLQNTIYTQQYYAKYGSLFSNGSYLNQLMLDKDVAENNTTTDVDYVPVYFSFTPDSTITVTSSEIRDYYKSHKENYKQNASRDAEYVVFEVVPSASDISATGDEIAEVYDEFTSTENMKAFLVKNSETPLSSYWYKAGELNTVSADVETFVSENTVGTSPVFQSGNTFRAVRIMGSAMVPDSAYVKHILLSNENASKADSLLNVLRKEEFSSVAAVWSADQSSAADGELGNIGWMTQTYIIPGFESVITADVNKPYVIKTQYGTHIVCVSKKTAPVLKKQVAILEKTALASKETFNNFYSQANKFATLAGGSFEGYKKAVDSLGVYSHPVNGMTEATSTFGAIEQAKEVTRWVFDAKKGKASNIITVNNNYFFVAAVKEIHKEGYADIRTVAPSIKDILYFEKLQDKTCKEVAEKIAGVNDLEAIAEMFNSSVISNTEVAFSSRGAAGVDPALAGAASVAEIGKICGPVAGGMGVFVFKVNGRETGAFYTAEDARTTARGKAQYSSQMIMPSMMVEADVKDNRARFF